MMPWRNAPIYLVISIIFATIYSSVIKLKNFNFNFVITLYIYTYQGSI